MAENNLRLSPSYRPSAVPHTEGQANVYVHDTQYPPASEDEHHIDATDSAVISEALAWIPSRPSSQQFPALERPVAVPQIQPNSFRSGPMPFCRAYAPALAGNSVSCEDFVAFIDNLTIAQAPAAPFKALQLAGTGVGFVPHHWAQAASAGMGMAAGIGSTATSIARTKLYLKKVNEQYFAPRGLKVTIASDEQLRSVLHADPNGDVLAPPDESANILTIPERRIKALQHYISPLDFNVPAPEEQTNVLNRLAAKQIQVSIKKTREKAVKEARKRGSSPVDATVTSHVPSDSDHSTDEYGSDVAIDDGTRRPETVTGQQLPPPPSQNVEHDPKIEALRLQIQEVNLKAQRQMMTETKDKRKEKIEKEKNKEIAKIEAKINDQAKSHSKNASDHSSKRDKHSSQHHHKDSKKDSKKEEKEAQKAAKLKWILVGDLNMDAHRPNAKLAL